MPKTYSGQKTILYTFLTAQIFSVLAYVKKFKVKKIYAQLGTQYFARQHTFFRIFYSKVNQSLLLFN